MENEPAARLGMLWQRLAGPLPGDAAIKRECFDRTIAAYCEPHRAYHNLTHLDGLFQQLQTLTGQSFLADELFFAAWYHDVVYDPRASDNEARSAEWAARDASNMGFEADRIRTMERLILATKHSDREPSDQQTAQLLDADLSILGASKGEYRKYADDIRREYAFVPDADYRAGRTRVLRSFLDRPRIYFTREMAAERETYARGNMTEEIRWFEKESC